MLSKMPVAYYLYYYSNQKLFYYRHFISVRLITYELILNSKQQITPTTKNKN